MTPAHRWLAVYCLLWTAAVSGFVASEQLRSFSDDSVSYLIMGRYWSPWHEVPAAIADIYPYELYPPLFGWLLAVTDAAWHMPWAHVLVVILLGMTWYACFHLARHWLNNDWAALAVVVLLSLASYSLIHVQRIVSENLYLLLTFAVLWVAQLPPGHAPGQSNEQSVFGRQAVLLASLLAMLVLTRSTGLVMVIAWFVQQSLAGITHSGHRTHTPAQSLHMGLRLGVGLIPIIAWLLWSGLRPDIAGDRYSSDLLKGLLGFDLAQPLESLKMIVWPQVVALRDAWYSVWMVYWVEDLNLSYVIVSITGILGGAGLIARLRSNQLDAWYVLGTLALLSLWPYPGQMIRFFYVIAPLWLLYALLAIRLVAVALPVSKNHRSAIDVYAVNGLVIMMIVAVLPAIGHIVGRANYPDAQQDYPQIAEFYLRFDPQAARYDAQRQLLTFADMQRIKQSTRPQDRVFWNTAGYIPLLANRYEAYFPHTRDQQAFLQGIADSRATHIYLSRFNPRRTTQDNNELKLYPLLQPWTTPLWVRNDDSGQTESMLLKIQSPKLMQQISHANQRLPE